MRPTDKDGVVLQLGSFSNFSKDLLELDRETTPLRVLPSCPRNFKRTSVEHYFREKGFAVDWCAFRLLVFDTDISGYQELTSPKTDANDTKIDTTTSKPLRNNNYYYSERLRSLGKIPMPVRSQVPKRAISDEFILSAIPAIVFFVLSAVVLFGLLWFQRKEEPEEEWQAFTESLFLVVKVFLREIKQDICNY